MNLEPEHQHDDASEAEETHQGKKGLSKKHKSGIAIVISLVVIILAVGLTWLYTGSLSSAKEKVFKTIPLPAAIVDMKFLPAKNVINRVELSKQLQESQGVKDQVKASDVYSQIIDDKKLEAVADHKKISVKSSDIDEQYKSIVNSYAGGDEEGLKKELSDTYHMSPDEFKAQVVKQKVLQDNLALWYNEQTDLNSASYEKANGFKDKLTNGESFEEVAKAYTQDEATKDFAGDSKMIAFDDLLPEFRENLKDSKPGDVKVLASRYGIHVLKVLEMNNDGENGAKQVHLQQIFVKPEGFEDWVNKEIENVRVLKLLKFA